MSARIQQIYIALFNRPADPLGLAFWNQQTNNGANLAPMLATLASTAEYQGRFTGLTAAQQVNSIYQALFGRDADLAGLTFFVNQLQSGALTLATLAVNILDGAQGTDAQIVANKVASAQVFTTAIDTTAEVLAYSGAAGIAAGTAFLAPVTADAATVRTEAQANASLSALVAGGGPGVPGQTFTLTTQVGENVVGTENNDTFVAVVGGAADNTLNVGDQINGLGGTDTLNLFVAGAAAELPAGVSIQNVEIVNLISTAGANAFAAVNAGAFVGATQVWQVGATTSAAVTGAGAGTTIGFRNTSLADVTFTSTTGNIAVENATGASSLVGKSATVQLETVNISGSQNAAGTLTFDAGANTAIASINVSLAGKDTTVAGTSLAEAELATFNASGSTAGITVNLTAANNIQTVTMGSGKDVVTLEMDAKSTTVDLGAGNDTLNLNATGVTAGVGMTITLGAGNDVANIADTTNIVTATKAGFEAEIVKITDFNAGQDFLALTGAGARFTLTTTQQGALNTAIADGGLFGALNYLATITGAADIVVFQFDGSTFIYDNNAGTALSAGDGLIQLVGFTGTLDATNFSAVA